MTKMSDINDNEIRVIGGDGGGGGKKRLPWWVWVIVGVVAVAIAVVALWPKPQPEEPTVPDTTTVTEPETTDIWHSNTDNSLPSCTIVTDTLIDTLHLRIFTPYNATPELHVGRLDTADTDIILASMAADLRRDNGRIVGAFVHAGEPLSWGLSKRGYCAIFDGQITIGVAENSPLFEQATEQGGYFFRQYPAVDKGVMVENNPENASFRRALCGKDRDNLETGNGTEETFDGQAQYRPAIQRKELLGKIGTHAGAVAPGHHHEIFFSLLRHRR